MLHHIDGPEVALQATLHAHQWTLADNYSFNKAKLCADLIKLTCADVFELTVPKVSLDNQVPQFNSAVTSEEPRGRSRSPRERPGAVPALEAIPPPPPPQAPRAQGDRVPEPPAQDNAGDNEQDNAGDNEQDNAGDNEVDNAGDNEQDNARDNEQEPEGEGGAVY